MKYKERRYRCRRCGHETLQGTNHTGSTWSFDRLNTCPKCPPFAKYPELGGQTIWDCIEEDAETPPSDEEIAERSKKISDIVGDYFKDD